MSATGLELDGKTDLIHHISLPPPEGEIRVERNWSQETHEATPAEAAQLRVSRLGLRGHAGDGVFYF